MPRPFLISVSLLADCCFPFLMLLVGAMKAVVVFFASSSAVTAEATFFTGSCV